MIRIENGSKMQKKFSDFEKLYDTLRQDHLIPDSATSPPKRKFLQAETKLADRRKVWIESFVQELLSSLSQKYIIYIVKQDMESKNSWNSSFRQILSHASFTRAVGSLRVMSRPQKCAKFGTRGKATFDKYPFI